jgi:hypothetical protein
MFVCLGTVALSAATVRPRPLGRQVLRSVVASDAKAVTSAFLDLEIKRPHEQ